MSELPVIPGDEAKEKRRRAGFNAVIGFRQENHGGDAGDTAAQE